MGLIVDSKPVKEKVVYDVLINEEEHLFLKGHMDLIHIFSDENFKHETAILRRGHKNGATYLKIPNCLKSRKKTNYSQIHSQKIEEDSKVYYIFTLDKE
jgi:hypothetical protein